MKHFYLKQAKIFLFIFGFSIILTSCIKSDPELKSTPPGIPTGLAITVKPNETSVTISWEAPDTAGETKDGNPEIISKYEVQISKNADFKDATKKDSDGAITFLEMTSLDLDGGIYYFRVRAINSGNREGDYSDSVSKTIEKTDDSKPSAPVDLAIRKNTETSVNFYWKAGEKAGKKEDGSESTISKYEYQVSKNADFKDAETKVSTKTSVEVSNLEANGSVYYFRVRSINSENKKSKYSDSVERTIGTFRNPKLPTKPTGLTVAKKTETSATVSWTASDPGKKDDGSDATISKYAIQVAKSNDFKDARLVDATGTSVEVSNLEANGSVYYFRVKAINSEKKESEYSTNQSYFSAKFNPKPDKPIKPYVISEEGGIILVRWNVPENQGRKEDGSDAIITEYEVQVSETKNFEESKTKTFLPKKPSLSIPDLKDKTTYYFRFRTVNSGNIKSDYAFKETYTNHYYSDTTPTNSTYKVSVDFNWTSTNNTKSFGDFPSGAHFSPLVVSTHKNNASFYTRGEIASNGVKIMAETGGSSTLSKEIDIQITEKEVFGKIIGSTAQAKQTKDFGEIKASGDFHYISMVSMIAPSPDWFIAKRNVNLKNNKGEWLKTITIELRGYDAGTDSGEKFTSSNSPTNPKKEIKLFTGEDNIIFATVTLTQVI